MNNDLGKPGAIRGKVLSCVMLGLSAVSTAFPAIAAPPTPAPDETDHVAGATFGYLWITGAAFHPLDNATTYSYPGGGCISKTGGAGNLFAHKVVLPEGTIVRFLRLYFYDTSTSTVTAFFTTYDGAGNFNERTNVGSSNAAGGFGTTLSPQISYEVDRFAAAINVVANLGLQNDTTLRFCGVRIAYDAPITDRIFANGFDLTPL